MEILYIEKLFIFNSNHILKWQTNDYYVVHLFIYRIYVILYDTE